ncbi:MAG: leucyl/phenylalanyl-tRNA--protein transferase [Planctomycetota bacterium]|nr:leucyl/phenylalanyl-tRNA--protein transferase [Planctomycetota bacterium]
MSHHFEQPYFPPVYTARPDGLLMIGGRLTPPWLVAAYSRGIFPWPVVDDDREILAWFSPDPRAILRLDTLHVSRRLQRRMQSGEFQVSFNRDFAGVISACAAPRDAHGGTWITPTLAAAYRELHELGHAHSVEVWHDEHLVGGVYGVALGGFFAGESMFHLRRDASKVALVSLVERLQQRGFSLFDVQQPTSHLVSLGAITIPRAAFLRRLKQALAHPVSFAATKE